MQNKTVAEIIMDRIDATKKKIARIEKAHLKEKWRGLDKTELPCAQVELKILDWCYDQVMRDAQQDMFLMK